MISSAKIDSTRSFDFVQTIMSFKNVLIFFRHSLQDLRGLKKQLGQES